MQQQPSPLTLEQIKTSAPFPWKTGFVTGQFHRVVMVDARGQEVPLFHITRLAELVTEKLNKNEDRPDTNGA